MTKCISFSVLKDEPEDLTHLAPTAGDACVPLDLPQLSDMFDDFLNENYCPLLNTDELNSLSDSQSSCNSKASGDPFFSYRDDSDSAGSPSDLNGRMQSPCFTKVRFCQFVFFYPSRKIYLKEEINVSTN